MKYVDLHLYFGKRVYQYVAALTGTLSILSSEMHFGWTSPSLPVLTKGLYKFQITSDEASWLAVILLAGTIVGAIFTGAFADIFGRKKIILLTAVPLFTAWILIGTANSVVELYIARFIAGLSSGICISTVPMYLGEIAEPKVRGMLASLCPVCVVLGILLVNILGNFLSIDRTAFIASIIPVVLFLTFMWMPESPSFLLLKHRTEEARDTLAILRGEEGAERELKRLSAAIEEMQKDKSSPADLVLVRTNRKAAMVAYGLRTIQQFCGTTAITFYCKAIFEQADGFISARAGPIIYFSIHLVGVVIASFLVDIFGRRPLLIVSLLGTSLTLFLLSAYIYVKDCTEINTTSYNSLPIIALLLNVCFISLGIRNIPLLMMGEMFSTNIKPTAVCVGTIFYSILATTSAKLFHITNELFGMYVPFVIFAILSCLSILFVVFCVPETKGKTLEDIQRELEGKNTTREKCCC